MYLIELVVKLKGNSPILSYMSIVCIMLFVVSFAIGLGPIPFIYTAECFRQNARSSAMALSTLFNWTAGLVLTLLFPFMLELVQQYVFVIFACVIAFALSMIMSKVRVCLFLSLSFYYSLLVIALILSRSLRLKEKPSKRSLLGLIYSKLIFNHIKYYTSILTDCFFSILF